MKTSDNELSDNAVRLLQVMDYYSVTVYRIGGGFKAICPFHDDKNPSMLIDLENGSFHCFGCGASGGASDFVKLMERMQGNILSDFDACEIMAGICAMSDDKVPEIRAYYGSVKKRGNFGDAAYRELYAESYDYYHGLRTVDWYSPKNAEENEALDYMTFRGFSPAVLNAVKAKVTYTWAYPIIFPIMDNGKFRGWVCRSFDYDVSQKRKYLYNTGFSRVNTLAGEYSENCELLYICEGYLDRLKLLQFGISDSVALLGWKMADEQCKKIQSCNPCHIVSMLDNDDAGKRGTDYLIKVFGDDKVIKFKFFENVKDPGEMNFNAFTRMNNKTLQQLHH